MSDKLVRFLKIYEHPQFRPNDNLEERERAHKVELKHLEDEVKRLGDRLERLEFEIEHQVKMLTTVLNGESEETYESIKRRISQLKGSLNYRGRF